jgi:inner membrane protein
MIAATLASVLPDIDYATLLWGVDVFLTSHRGVTHSVFALAAAPPLIAFAFGGRRDFISYYVLCVLCYGAHIGLDLTNPYGVRLLAPLDYHLYTIDAMSATEPLLVGVLLAALVVGHLSGGKMRTAALASLAFVLVLVAARFELHGRALAFARGRMPDYVVARVTPMPNDFLRWFVVLKGEGAQKTGYVDLLAREVEVVRVYPDRTGDELVARSREAKEVRTFLGVARNPYAERIAVRKGVEVRWGELDYTFGPYRKLSPWVRFNAGGAIAASGFGESR